MVDLSDADADVLLNDRSLDELYVSLGRADQGPAIHSALIATGMSSMSSALTADVSAASVWDWLKKKGEALFDLLWPSIKDIACKAYDAENKTDKDWIKGVAATVLAAVSITAAVAILVLAIAIKKGLDTLCPADPQAAAVAPAGQN